MNKYKKKIGNLVFVYRQWMILEFLKGMHPIAERLEENLWIPFLKALV